MKDPLAKFRKRWPDFPEPFKHSDIMVKDIPLNSPNILALADLRGALDALPNGLRAELRKLQDELRERQEDNRRPIVGLFWEER